MQIIILVLDVPKLAPAGGYAVPIHDEDDIALIQNWVSLGHTQLSAKMAELEIVGMVALANQHGTLPRTAVTHTKSGRDGQSPPRG